MPRSVGSHPSMKISKSGKGGVAGSANDLALDNLAKQAQQKIDNPASDQGETDQAEAAPSPYDTTMASSGNFTPDDLSAASHDMDMEAKYGDRPLEAFAEGVGRGAIPFFDRLATWGGADPEELREVKLRNSTPAGVGEFGGLAGSMLVGGGLGGAVTGAEEGVAHAVGNAAMGLPADANLAEKIAQAGSISKGAGANKFLESVFANQAEKSMGRKIIEKSISRMAGGAVAGAGLGVNALINENALGDADLTGENLLAYAGTGAVLNGLVGGAFGAGEAILPVAKQAIDDATGQLRKTVGEHFDYNQNAAELTGGSPKEIVAKKDFLDATDKPGAYVTKQDIKDFWEKDIELQTFDSPKAVLRKFDDFADETGKRQQQLFDRVDKIAGDKVVPVVDSHIQLMDALKQVPADNPEVFHTQAAKTVFSRAMNHVMNRFDSFAANGTEFESANSFIDAVREFGKKGARAFDNPEEARITDLLYASLNRKAREIIQNNIERVVANTPDSTIPAEMKALNKKWQIYYALKPGLEKKAINSKAFLALKDEMLGVLGHAVGGNAGGVLGVVGSKLLNSDLKRRFVVLNTAERANIQATKKVAEGVKDFFEGTAKASAAAAKTVPRMSLMNSGFAVANNKKPDNEQAAFKNIQSNLADLTNDPDKLLTKMTNNTMRANYAAPNATRFAQTAMTKAVSFLYDKMPKTSNVGMFPTEFKPSSLDLAKFQRYVQAVENPYSVMDDLKAGTLTREHVEALQAVYPAIYSQVQQKALSYVQSHPDLSYAKKVQLGTLLGVATDSSMQPLTVAARQMTFQEQQQPPAGAVKSTAKGVSNLKLSERHQSMAENLESGGDQ